jgi:ATP-dependent Zn protease
MLSEGTAENKMAGRSQVKKNSYYSAKTAQDTMANRCSIFRENQGRLPKKFYHTILYHIILYSILYYIPNRNEKKSGGNSMCSVEKSQDRKRG